MNTVLFENPEARIDMEYLSRLSDEHRESTVIAWLMGEDEVRRALAMEVSIATGASFSTLLVARALSRGKRVVQRVRLLQAVERIAKPLDPSAFFDLLSAMRRYGPEVEIQIARVLAVHRLAQ